MHFTKMHGIGNDYIYVSTFDQEAPADPAKLAVVMSDRHSGIGGDGLILIMPSARADARMRMFNADGSEGEMCGNGVRCVAKYLYEHDLARKSRLVIETGRGLLVLDLDSGKEIASLPGAADTDDMWFDATRKRIYVPSGEGFIFVYQQIDPDRYQRIAKIPTAIGARTSAYYGQVGKHNSLYLAVPARANRGAELWIYETRD